MTTLMTTTLLAPDMTNPLKNCLREWDHFGEFHKAWFLVRGIWFEVPLPRLHPDGYVTDEDDNLFISLDSIDAFTTCPPSQWTSTKDT